MRNGKGKEYNIRGKLIYQGEYSNGNKLKGKGYNTKGIPVCEYTNGKKIERFENGRAIFIGEYLSDRRWNGTGYDNLGNKVFEIKDGKGEGKIYNYASKLLFEGEYINGLKNGKAIE